MMPKRLNQQPVQCHLMYTCILYIHGIAVINIYAPPGEQEKMADLLMDVWISHNLGGYPWIAAGDTNETQDGQIAAALEQLEGTCVSTGKATRFEGKADIDWFSTSRPRRWRNLDACDEFKFSDHKLVSLEMLTSAKPAQRFRFCPQPKWNKRSFLQMNQWQQLLQLAWNKLANETCKPLMRLDPSEINVDLEWTNYMTLLSHTYRDATALAESKATEPAHFAEIRRALRQARAKHGKGIQPPKVQSVQKEIKTGGHTRADMADRKLAKKLARLHEFNRLARQAIQHSNVHFLRDCSENLQILAKKIGLTKFLPALRWGKSCEQRVLK